MTTELTSTPNSTLKMTAIRPDRTPVEVSNDSPESVTQAIEARRKQFVEEIARQHGLEKGKLVIEKDSETGRFIHTLIDPESGDVIRQWPDEDWLKFARQSGGTKGLWLDQKA